MSDQEHGPPGKKVRPGASHDARPNQKVSNDTTTAANDSRSGRQGTYDPLAGNGRRHNATRRMPPVPTCRCGRCVRDPDYDRHRCDNEISDHMAESAVAAIAHLDGMGTPALLDRATCHAVHRIGHRRLALDVHRRSAGAL